MSKKVKIIANVEMREKDVPLKLWGVFFTCEDDKYVAEVDADLAEQMIENERAIEAPKEKKATAAPAKTDVDFASDEAGELHATLVKDKKLTKAEYKKIEGTGDNGAITVGDLEDYVASKTPATPAAPAPVKTK